MDCPISNYRTPGILHTGLARRKRRMVSRSSCTFSLDHSFFSCFGACFIFFVVFLFVFLVLVVTFELEHLICSLVFFFEDSGCGCLLNLLKNKVFPIIYFLSNTTLWRCPRKWNISNTSKINILWESLWKMFWPARDSPQKSKKIINFEVTGNQKR